jgi:hypothetical protein
MNEGLFDKQDTARERAVLREWDYLQQSLFNFAIVVSHSPGHSLRNMIEDHIAQITAGCARVWWEPYIAGNAAKDSRLFEIHYQQIRYGMLEIVDLSSLPIGSIMFLTTPDLAASTDRLIQRRLSFSMDWSVPM